MLAYGKFGDKSNFGEVKPIFTHKLKMLTLVQMCLAQKCLSYEHISKECGTQDVEALVLECYQNSLVECRID